jgi:DNA-binding transcriptional LysR family regulator
VAEQSVHVGATSLLAATALSEAVAEFRAERPSVNVHAISLDPDDVYDALMSNRVDFAVAYREYVVTDLETEPLIESRVICAAAPGHPLADGVPHTPEELLQYPIALTTKGMGLRGKVERWFEDNAGIKKLPVSFEARTGALLAQVAASMSGYITFLPERSLQQFSLTQVHLAGPRIPSSAVICYLPGQRHRPVVTQFLETLRAVAARIRLTEPAGV